MAFAGMVTGHTSDTSVLQSGERVYGLVVEIDETLIGSLQGQAAVFVLGVDAHCKPVARAEQDVNGQYPIGSSVTVAGTIQPHPVGSEQIPAVTTATDGFGHVAATPTGIQKSDLGLLDFRSFSRQYEKQRKRSFSIERAWRNAHRSWYEDYEYLRALRLLELSRDQQQRIMIASELVHYVRFRHLNPDFALNKFLTLLRTHQIPEATRRELCIELQKILSR